jgi:hypothetical protein
VVVVLYLAIIVLCLVGMWMVYTKAGKPGWACIVPFYNIIVLCEIVGRPAWWLVLMFIPIVSFIVSIIILIDLAKSFGQGGGFAVGLIFLPFIFIPMLGLGSAKYLGPAAAGAGAGPVPSAPPAPSVPPEQPPAPPQA